jgi:hypothetical protein
VAELVGGDGDDLAGHIYGAGESGPGDSRRGDDPRMSGLTSGTHASATHESHTMRARADTWVPPAGANSRAGPVGKEGKVGCGYGFGPASVLRFLFFLFLFLSPIFSFF